MKKVFKCMIIAIFLMALVAGCSSDSDTPAESGESATLSLWSFTEELLIMARDYYLVDFPDTIAIEFTMIDRHELESRLDPAFAAGVGPDMFGVDVALTKKYVNGGILADLDHFRPLVADLEIVQYVVDIGTSPDGVLRSLSWQATPGGIWYRRDLAELYLGVSEPEDVQPLVANFDVMLDTARRIRDASDGN